MASEKILVGNIMLGGRSGTEIVTEELVRGLASRGRTVAAYSPNIGTLAHTMRADGLFVAENFEQIPWIPDVIHSNHFAIAAVLRVAFPKTPQVVFCHDASTWHDQPFENAVIRRYAAVDRLCAQRIVRAIPALEGDVAIVHNAVDLAKYQPRAALPAKPRRALIFAKHSNHIEAIEEACSSLHISTNTIGAAVGCVVADLDQRLPQYDLVFATARTALEAMAVGSAVLIIDGRGLAGMVTSANVAEWREWNFGGHLLKSPIIQSDIVQEIEKYDPVDAGLVRDFIRTENALDDALDRYECLYNDAISETDAIVSSRGLKEAGLAHALELLIRNVYPAFEREVNSSDNCVSLAEFEGKMNASRSEFQAIMNSRSKLFRRFLHVWRAKLL